VQAEQHYLRQKEEGKVLLREQVLQLPFPVPTHLPYLTILLYFWVLQGALLVLSSVVAWKRRRKDSLYVAKVDFTVVI
jgi:hypothetical protein